MNPARVAPLRLGMGEAMVAFSVKINCGSGIQSIDTAYRYIREGLSDLILAGGSEALSYTLLVWSQQGVRWFAGLTGAKRLAIPERRLRRSVEWPLLADFVAKVESPTTPEISRKSILRHLYRCKAF